MVKKGQGGGDQFKAPLLFECERGDWREDEKAVPLE